MRGSVGIDFGTTNSAIALAVGGELRLAQFPFFESSVDTFRSVLFFEKAVRTGAIPKPVAGPSAIERYLDSNEGGRLIQSLKSFAASRTFHSTQIGFRTGGTDRYFLEGPPIRRREAVRPTRKPSDSRPARQVRRSGQTGARTACSRPSTPRLCDCGV